MTVATQLLKPKASTRIAALYLVDLTCHQAVPNGFEMKIVMVAE